jgi:hypothetical protein
VCLLVSHSAWTAAEAEGLALTVPSSGLRRQLALMHAFGKLCYAVMHLCNFQHNLPSFSGDHRGGDDARFLRSVTPVLQNRIGVA